jgi:hypothetical protein
VASVVQAALHFCDPCSSCHPKCRVSLSNLGSVPLEGLLHQHLSGTAAWMQKRGRHFGLHSLHFCRFIHSLHAPHVPMDS